MTPLANHLLNHAVLGYANLWWRTDRDFLLGAKTEDALTLEKTLIQIAIKYKVIRGIPDGGKSTEWPKISRRILELPKLTNDNYIGAVEELGNLMVADGRRVSAASKLIWFRHKSPVKIYDARAVKALKFTGKGYASYCRLWNEKFDAAESEIYNSIHKVIPLLQYTVIPPEHHTKLFNVINRRWFAERVFDKYLWESGGD